MPTKYRAMPSKTRIDSLPTLPPVVKFCMMKSLRIARNRFQQKMYRFMATFRSSPSAASERTRSAMFSNAASRTDGGRTISGWFWTDPASLRLYFFIA